MLHRVALSVSVRYEEIRRGQPTQCKPKRDDDDDDFVTRGLATVALVCVCVICYKGACQSRP